MFATAPFGKEVLREVSRVKKLKLPRKWDGDWLCHIPEDPRFETPWGKGKEEIWQVLGPETHGYKIANEKYPYKPKRTT